MTAIVSVTPIAVARPAPNIPMLSPNTKYRSPKILKHPPHKVAKAANPGALSFLKGCNFFRKNQINRFSGKLFAFFRQCDILMTFTIVIPNLNQSILHHLFQGRMDSLLWLVYKTADILLGDFFFRLAYVIQYPKCTIR